MSDGAVDHDYDDHELTYTQRVENATENIITQPLEGGIVIDIVTRQAMLVRQRVADTLEEYYEENGFDLYTYKMHPYLPGISEENAVYECVYLDGNPQNAHKVGKCYDFPRARIMHYPVEMAWNDDMEVGEL